MGWFQTVKIIIECICKLSIAARSQVLGNWQGRFRGLISSAAEAAAACGICFDGPSVSQKGWGLRPKADRQRIIQALQDLFQI